MVCDRVPDCRGGTGAVSTAERATRDALWAEATLLYKAGETWHLGAGEDALMDDETEARVDSDPGKSGS
jgi:predicted P-loop ATPase